MKARSIAWVAPTFALALAAHAATVPLGASGWQASWDASLDPFVSIAVDAVTPDAVFIEKSAEFIQGPGPGGVFPSIPITFTQIAPTTVTNIVIDDEIITNSTGVDWTDFHFELLDGLDAFFNAALTATSGGPLPLGFSIAPFTTFQYGPTFQSLDVAGGVVPNGTQWFPGDGATDGQLWITVVPQPGPPFTTFTLKETPTPEPTAALAIALGLAAMYRRRR